MCATVGCIVTLFDMILEATLSQFFWFLFMLFSLEGIDGVPEPCVLQNVKDTAVASMCSNSIAVENNIDGSISNDSVLLRVVEQTEGCVCHVHIVGQDKDGELLLRKQGNDKNAFPIHDTCGLIVNIEHFSGLNVKHSDYLNCTEPDKPLHITVSINDFLRLRSQKIDGDFEKGYCLEIIRLKVDKNTNMSDPEKPRLIINCTEHTTESTTIENYITTNSKDTERTTGDFSTKGIITTQNPKQDLDTTITATVQYHDVKTTEHKDGDSTIYIAIGTVGIIVTVLVLVILIAKRKKLTSSSKDNDKAERSKSSYRNVETEPDDELQDNILYVSTEAYAEGNTNMEGTMVTPKDIALDVEGNYNTISFKDTSKSCDKKNIDLTKTPDTTYSKSGNSPDSSGDLNTETRDEKQQSEEPEETTNVYAVVNKTNTSSTLKENNAGSGTSLTGKTEQSLNFENRDNRSIDKSKSDDVHANQRKIIYHPDVEGDYSSIDFDGEKSNIDVTKCVTNNGKDTINAIENETLKEGDDDGERNEESQAGGSVLKTHPTVADRDEANEGNSDLDHVYSVVNKPFKKEI